jgi:TatD DNase family protein
MQVFYIMLLVDVHAHLDLKEFSNDIDEVMERCESKGVKAIICNSVTRESMGQVLSLSKKYPIVKPAFGIYPTHTVEYSEAEFKEVLAWIRKNKPFAIGETGLDYQEVPEEKRTLAEERFRAQIRLAKGLGVAIIVHSRKAEERTIEVLEEENASKVLMHCFSGRKQLVRRIVQNGWKLSIPANVLRSEHFQMIIKEAPTNALLTETDSPYLAPNVGDRNEPWQVLESLKVIAELKGITLEEASAIVWRNYQDLLC